MSLVVDPELLTADALARAAVILAVGILLLLSSLTTIIILCSNPSLHDVIGCYLVSWAVGLIGWELHSKAL